MGFSGDGKYLIAITGDNYHSVRIYDWKAKALLCIEKGHSDKILDIDNHPTDPNCFVTVGVKHVKFWKFDSASKHFITKKGLFRKAKLQVNFFFFFFFFFFLQYKLNLYTINKYYYHFKFYLFIFLNN